MPDSTKVLCEIYEVIVYVAMVLEIFLIFFFFLIESKQGSSEPIYSYFCVTLFKSYLITDKLIQPS